MPGWTKQESQEFSSLQNGSMAVSLLYCLSQSVKMITVWAHDKGAWPQTQSAVSWMLAPVAQTFYRRSMESESENQ